MEPSYIIVIPDLDLLTRLCGTNDSNLHLIEEHLGVEVYSRGNELSIGSSDKKTQENFKYVIDRLLDEVSEGNEADCHLLNSILNGSKLVQGSDDYRLFERSHIIVPGSVKAVFPKTVQQARLIESMRAFDMVFCVGPAGSGKTFLMMAEALKLLVSHEVSKIVLTRPVVEAGESLGFLPGDFEQKISPYLRPLYDAIEMLMPRESVKKLLESGTIEIAPLAYMRGRTLHDSVVILDEAQNTTCSQMKMFLTRMGERSKVFITGDITQTDLPKRTVSGLRNAVSILGDIDDIKVITMSADDVVRNTLVRKIVQAYEDHGKE